VQQLFGEYDPITGERISGWDRLLAGGMLLASFIPPVKGAGIAGKAGIKGAKAAETAVDVSKLVSQMKHVLRYDKIMPAFQAVYHQVVKAPITNTIRSFKKQWDGLLGSVRSVQWQPAFAGIGPVSRTGIQETAEEVTSSVRFSMSQAGDGVIGKGTGGVAKGTGEVVVPKVDPRYATAIDNKVTIKEQVELPTWLKETFKDGHYRTVVTNEEITVYRTFGGKARENGAFATTVPAANRIKSKIDSALLPEWKNSRQYEAVIEIPKGTELNIGKVEKQITQTGTVLEGGGDQILLPQNWPKEWIKEIREVPSR
jgi:hypothetical protein